MAKDINQTVREVCLWLPETEEFMSHGSANFRVRRGKTFAAYCINHHGDGRVALWLCAPPGAQALYTREEPGHFFVPPYVGPRGWLGVNLDKGISWQRVAKLVREAYENVAPARLIAGLGKTPAIKPPTQKLRAEDIDPLQSRRAQTVIGRFRQLCLALPQTSEGTAFGRLVWKAGKKTFAWAGISDGRLALSFWVGIDQQELLRSDERFTIPAYLGHYGWISLDVSRHANWTEIEDLTRFSYRHFALKRMLDALAGEAPSKPARKQPRKSAQGAKN
jgi:predicted DNA-binding protein (MmcQ/YjbR family)